MARDFLGTGWRFPPGADAAGTVSLSRFEADIKEAIWIILSTAKGERAMRPEFGCGIHDLVFAPINNATLREVETSVFTALTEFEPRIEIISVSASDREAKNGKLLISIDYRVIITNNEFNMVFPFYLSEGRP